LLLIAVAQASVQRDFLSKPVKFKEKKGFLQIVQGGSGDQTAYYSMGIGVLSRG
jgi:hypothetical protein